MTSPVVSDLRFGNGDSGQVGMGSVLFVDPNLSSPGQASIPPVTVDLSSPWSVPQTSMVQPGLNPGLTAQQLAVGATPSFGPGVAQSVQFQHPAGTIGTPAIDLAAGLTGGPPMFTVQSAPSIPTYTQLATPSPVVLNQPAAASAVSLASSGSGVAAFVVIAVLLYLFA